MPRPILTTALIAALVALALALAACGGDDDDETTATTPTTTAGATGATGATGAEDAGDGATYDITAAEFSALPLPDQVKAVEDYAADNPDECPGIEEGKSEKLLEPVAIQAATAEVDGDEDTPLTEILAEECGQL